MPGKLGGDLLDCFSVHGAILDVFSGTEGIEADVLRVVRRVDVLLHAAETDDRSQGSFTGWSLVAMLDDTCTERLHSLLR